MADDGVPTAPVPAAPRRPRLTGKVAAAAAAVVGVAVIGGVALAAIGDSGDKVDYTSACPSGPGADGTATGAVSSTTVACDGLEQTGDDEVVRIVELVSPKTVPLNWSYCNGLTCGNPDNAECVSNLWIPQFGSQIPAIVSIQGLGPGTKVTGVWVGAGSSPDTLKEAKGAKTSISADGTVNVDLSSFNAVTARLSDAINPKFDQVCGVPEDGKDAITDRYGTQYDNQQPYIRIQIEMETFNRTLETLTNIIQQQQQTSQAVITNIR
jgi:hypothetical protein